MGYAARRKLKTVNERIRQTRDMPKRLAFLLRHPTFGLCVLCAAHVPELVCGAVRGVRLAHKQNTEAIKVFAALARGRDAE